MWKLYKRGLKRHPHIGAMIFMALFTFSLSSYIGVDAIINHGKFSQSTFTKWTETQKEYHGRSVASTFKKTCHNSIDYNELQKDLSIWRTGGKVGQVWQVLEKDRGLERQTKKPVKFN